MFTVNAYAFIAFNNLYEYILYKGGNNKFKLIGSAYRLICEIIMRETYIAREFVSEPPFFEHLSSFSSILSYKRTI